MKTSNRTSDGIPMVEWDRLTSLAADYANQVSRGRSNEAKKTRTTILRYLTALRRRHGALPSILATRSDYLESPKRRETLLLQAFSAAKGRRDVKNRTLIASSLAELYYYDMKDQERTAMWLRKLEDELTHHYDKGEQRVLRELRKALKLL